MDRGPVALFGAIVAVGLGPAMWLGAQFGSIEVDPSRPPAVVGEPKSDADRLVGGSGAGVGPAGADASGIDATPQGVIDPRTTSPSPTPSATTSPPTTPPSSSPTSSPTRSSEPPTTPPSESTSTPTTPPTGTTGPTTPPDPPTDDGPGPGEPSEESVEG